MKEPSQSLSRFRNKPASKLKLICSFNGAFRVRPFSKNLRYIGGETRIISVDRTISFTKLRLKISDICPNIHSFTLKYQLPLDPDPQPNDDTPLVLIASDDDVRCMVEEYDKIESYGKHPRLWVFVCSDLYDNDDECSFDNNSNNNCGVVDDSLRKKVLKQQSLVRQSCESPLIDLDFGPVPYDSVVKNDPFQVNVTNGMGNGRMRPLNPRDGNVRNVAVGANASVECLMGQSYQGLCNGVGNTILMCNSLGGKQDFGNTGEMAFSNFNRENIMPWGASCGLMNNHLESQSCSNRRFGSGYSSCVGDRVLDASQSGLRSHRFGVNDARYQQIYPYYLRNHRNNLVEVGNHRGVRLDGKIPVGKCNLGIRPNSNISKQGHSMRSYDANFSSPWPGFTEHASEGGASVTCSGFNKGSSTFDVQYGEKFREQGGPAISRNRNSNVVESHLACHGLYNVTGDKFLLSHTTINHPSTFVRVMNTQEDQLTGSIFEQQEVQCHTLCDNFHRMPISCEPILSDLENEKFPIDSEENANISGHSSNISSGCNMKNGTKKFQGGVASSMDLLYKLSLSSSKEIVPPQNSSLHNAAAGRIDVHQEEFQQELLSVMSLGEKVDSKRTSECSKLIGGISCTPASYVTHLATGPLQTIKTSDLEYIKELGSGTYGTVFFGKWKGSDVAIKRMKPSCFTDGSLEEDRLVADFWREAHMLAQLHHPNVVAFYGVVTDGSVINLATVTEYMVNGSLKQVLRRRDRTIDRRKRIIIAMDAAFGMEYLHEKNIVHFDLKSHNFLVNMRDPQRPVCKIGDLGLSKIKQKTFISGGVRGTIPWMAPELFNSKNNLVTEKIDVYSFGIVMWELLTGEEPYEDLHSEEIIVGILKGSLRPEIPRWCEPTWSSLMERCWSSDPISRPAFSKIAKELRAMAASMNIK